MKREEFEKMPFFTHVFLAGIPLHTLDLVELKGGRQNMKMDEIYEITGFKKVEEINVGTISKILFWLRQQIGHLLRWDNDDDLFASNSYISHLSEEEKANSLIESGKTEGDTRILYCYENEFLGEIINKTVHCFWFLGTEKTARGYNLISAVYVKKLNWRTPIYMALVTPVLKWIIYPSIMKDVKRRWAKAFSNQKVLVEKEFV